MKGLPEIQWLKFSNSGGTHHCSRSFRSVHCLDWTPEYVCLAFYSIFSGISRAAPAGVEGHKVQGTLTHLSLPQSRSSFHFNQHELGTSRVPRPGPAHGYLEYYRVP